MSYGGSLYGTTAYGGLMGGIKIILIQDYSSGSEALDIYSQISLTDSVIAVDLSSIFAEISLQDTGSGIEAFDISATINIQENGSLSESINIFTETLLSESASGNDTIGILAEIFSSDSGVAIDILSVKNDTITVFGRIQKDNQLYGKIKQMISLGKIKDGSIIIGKIK